MFWEEEIISRLSLWPSIETQITNGGNNLWSLSYFSSLSLCNFRSISSDSLHLSHIYNPALKSEEDKCWQDDKQTEIIQFVVHHLYVVSQYRLSQKSPWANLLYICCWIIDGAVLSDWVLFPLSITTRKSGKNCWDIKALSSFSSGIQTWISILEPWAINESTSLNLASGDYFKSSHIL